MYPSNTKTQMVAVFIETSLSTYFGVSIHPDTTVKQLISKLEVEHYSCFHEFGRIKITSLQVKRGCHMYHLSHSVPLRLFVESCNAWFVHAAAFQISSTREPSNRPEIKEQEEPSHVATEKKDQEEPSHVATEKKEQEKASNCKFRSFDLGNRVVRAAERLTPCPKRLKLSKLVLTSETRYATLMANAFSFE